MTSIKEIQLIFLDEAFERVAILVKGRAGFDFSSLEWKSVFHKQDEFTIECPVAANTQTSPEIAALLNGARFVVRGDTGQTVYLQKKEFDGSKLILEGIGAEGLLAKRFTVERDYLPPEGATGQNKVGKVMCDIINDNRPFDWLVADADQNQTGVSIATYTELTGNVYKYVQMLSEAYDVGFQCIYSEKDNKVHFTTFEVVPLETYIEGRTEQLSDEIGNIKDATYEHDVAKYYNYAQVVGEDDYTVVVDQSDGGEVYEYSFKSSVKLGSKTTAEYSQLLYAAGVQELAKRRIDESFVVTPQDTENIELGWEAVSISRLINKMTTSFCTEILETWENAYTREVTMGYRADAEALAIIGLQGEF